MASLRSNFLPLLALAAICPWAARAGDKIEFSAPDDSLTVPQVEHAEKDSKADTEASGPPINRKILDAAETSYTVVVYNAPKRREERASDSAYSDDEDNGMDADDNADPDRRVSRSRDANVDSSSVYSEKKDSDAASELSLRSRLEAEDNERANGGRGDEHYSGIYSDSGEDSPWTRDSFRRAMPQDQSVVQRLSTFSYNLFHQASSGAERLSARMQDSENLKTIHQQQYDSHHPSAGLDDPQSSYGDLQAPRSPEAYSSSQYDDLRRHPEQDSAGGPLTIVPGEYSSVSLNPDSFVRPESFSSQQRLRAQPEPPAILKFPKRPGDLLR